MNWNEYYWFSQRLWTCCALVYTQLKNSLREKCMSWIESSSHPLLDGVNFNGSVAVGITVHRCLQENFSSSSLLLFLTVSSAAQHNSWSGKGQWFRNRNLEEETGSFQMVPFKWLMLGPASSLTTNHCLSWEQTATNDTHCCFFY